MHIYEKVSFKVDTAFVDNVSIIFQRQGRKSLECTIVCESEKHKSLLVGTAFVFRNTVTEYLCNLHYMTGKVIVNTI